MEDRSFGLGDRGRYPARKGNKLLDRFDLARNDLSDDRPKNEWTFLEHLHKRSRLGGWYPDLWFFYHDRVVATVTVLSETGTAVETTLRVDRFETKVVVGFDRSHQMTDDLNDQDFNYSLQKTACPTEAANFGADWLEANLAELKNDDAG